MESKANKTNCEMFRYKISQAPDNLGESHASRRTTRTNRKL